MTNMKQAQVTIFILLGLLILFFVGFFLFYIQMTKIPTVAKENPIATNLRVFVSSCLENQLQEAISFIALHGGYFEASALRTKESESFTQNVSWGVPYYFYEGQNLAPTKEDVEQQLALAIQSYAGVCMNFSSYPNNYNITVLSNSLSVQTIMTPTSIQAEITFPVQVEVENTVHTVDTFPVEQESSLYTLYSSALEITKEQEKDITRICYSCLSSLAQDANFYLGMVELEAEQENSILYVLNDRYKNRQNELSFYFVHGFLKQKSETSLEITSIEKQRAIIGYLYTYSVIAYGENFSYTDDSSVFEIDSKSGIISFTPRKEDIGSWIVTITVTDTAKKTAQQSFLFEVADVVSSELSLEPFSYFVAHVGEEFNYTIEVTANQSMYFLDDTDLFDINAKTGLISFIPTSSQKGAYNFTITVIDELGNSAEQKGYMVITS